MYNVGTNQVTLFQHKSHSRHWTPVVLLVTMLLAACSPTSDQQSINQTYLDRMATVLEKPIVPVASVSYDPIPAAAKMQSPQIKARISLFDLDVLRLCQLDMLVAEHNSALGKVQQPSQQFVYENAFQLKISQCLLDKGDMSDEDFQQLSNIATEKSAAPIIAFSNMLVSSNSIRNLFQYHPSPGNKQSVGYLNTLDTLQYLVSLHHQLDTKGTVNPKDIDLLEEKLAQIDNNRQVGALLTALKQGTHYLAAAIDMLEDAEVITQCNEQGVYPKQQYLRNVFDKYYVEQVQAFNADINAQWQALSPLLLTLYSAVNQTTPSPWLTQHVLENQDYLDFVKLNKAHAQRWRRYFDQCSG